MVSQAKPRFGDLVDNGWASADNPTRRGFFVRETRSGARGATRTWEITDGKGKFWRCPLDSDHKLTWAPVHREEGRRSPGEARFDGLPERVNDQCADAGTLPALDPKVVWSGRGDYEPTEAMIEAGEWHNHRHNSLDNMVASFKAMMQQAEIDGLVSFIDGGPSFREILHRKPSAERPE